MKTNLKNWSQGARKAFTLIELLIVITIIGILAVALLPSVLGAPARARDAARKADLTNIVAALESYNIDNNSFPPTAGCVSAVFSNNADKYFAAGKIPSDPQAANAVKIEANNACPGQYFYCPVVGLPGSNYVVAARVEIPGDGNAKQDDVHCAIQTILTKSGDLTSAMNPVYVVVK